MFWKGRTAIEGLSGRASDGPLRRRARFGENPVADARNRDDPFAAARRLAERLAQRRDLDGKVALFDRQARPGRIDKLRLCRHFAWIGQKASEDQCALLPNRHQLPVAQKGPVFGI
jgi:hypothetical protein